MGKKEGELDFDMLDYSTLLSTVGFFLACNTSIH